MADDLIFLHAQHRPHCVATVDKRFDYHTLQFMTQGSVSLSYDTRRHDLQGGAWIWPCYPGPWIRFHEHPPGNPWDHRYVAFTGPRVTAWDADGLWNREPQRIARHDVGVLAGMFDEVINLATSPGRWPQLWAINALERILIRRAETSQPSAPAQPAWIGTVLQRLATPETDIDYHELAKSVAMSLTTLRRKFRAATGQSLHQYHLEHRAAHARHLLGTTDEPIKQVASRLGYRDVFYFTRQFTQLTGVSPATYRRSRQ